MDKSENLELPYIMPNQAQKHVTHNEAIRYLDALVQVGIVSRDLNSPPDNPDSGSRYIVAETAIGDWAGKDNQIAAFQDGAWAFYNPQDGWLAWSIEENMILVFQGGSWQVAQSSMAQIEQVNLLGVNASATQDARFGVSSNDSFLTHEGASHRLSINKATVEDTGSLIFKTNWTGHAEMGLAGNNDFSIKVTSDGVNWNDGLVLDSQSGKVSFPSGVKNPQLSGTPDSLTDMDIIYLDQTVGDDANDGTSYLNPIKSLQRLEELFPVGRRLQLRLLSDVVWDYAIRISYPIAMLEILGRNADNSGYENKTVTVKDSVNLSNLPGCIQMICLSNVFLRNIDVILDTSKGQSFINYSSTLGYLRTLSVNLSRTGSGTCCLYADGSSFVASRHQSIMIDDSAKGYVAQGISADENPNDDWRYASNLTSY
jgi:hypothetical protein